MKLKLTAASSREKRASSLCLLAGWAPQLPGPNHRRQPAQLDRRRQRHHRLDVVRAGRQAVHRRRHPDRHRVQHHPRAHPPHPGTREQFRTCPWPCPPQLLLVLLGFLARESPLYFVLPSRIAPTTTPRRGCSCALPPVRVDRPSQRRACPRVITPACPHASTRAIPHECLPAAPCNDNNNTE